MSCGWVFPMTSANLSREEAAQRSASIIVRSYDVIVDVRGATDAAQPMFDTTSTITFDASTASTWLDLLDAEVDSVVVNDEPVEVRYDGARIPLDGLRTDATNVVTVTGRGTYSRSGQGLHRFVDPEDQRTYLYTQYEPADSRRVFANFEQPDLKAVFNLVVLAPEGWTVLGNQPATAVIAASEGGSRHEFAPTPKLSTYLTVLCAGEWARVAQDAWTSPTGLEVDLGLYSRRSLARFVEADEVLAVTKQGMDWYDANFGTPYPWGKYDQIFVPEYNLGAMENPGCVTFTEQYVFRSAATRAQRQGRANTILHEMAHMWFGDLVTPAWWDDLWLKESFAEFMGAHVSVEATEYEQAWVAFAGRRKAWAYAQDQLPTTHPIVADITDLEAAAQNFDGITYAKGAAVLRQLVAFVGLDNFLAGSRAYFTQHAFSTARLDDLLRALEDVSGRDLGAWSRAWLQTAGPDELVPELLTDGGQIESLAVHQESLDARTGAAVGRPHSLAVGLYRFEGAALLRDELLRVELDGTGTTAVLDAVGLQAPDLVLVNDTDLTYAKVGLDGRSLRTALDHLSALGDPLARALVWSSLWNMTRDARLPVANYLAGVMAHAPAETDSATLTELLGNCWTALSRFLPPQAREELRAAHAQGLLDGLRGATPGSDQQLVWARAVARAAVDDPTLADAVQREFDPTTRTQGLELGTDLRWAGVQALVAQGRMDDGALSAERKLDPSAGGRVQALAAQTSRPDAAVKTAAWQRVHTPRGNSNDEVDALVAGLTVAGQDDLVRGFSGDWFDGLEHTWSSHALEIAQRLVRGLFPPTEDAPELAGAWLAAHPDAPGALRRLVLEGQDQALRARRVRQAQAVLLGE